jgi:hypothetical protein
MIELIRLDSCSTSRTLFSSLVALSRELSNFPGRQFSGFVYASLDVFATIILEKIVSCTACCMMNDARASFFFL